MKVRLFASFLVLVFGAYALSVWIHKRLSDKFTLLETSIQEQGSRLDPIATLVDKVAALESVVLEQQGLSDQFTLLETSVREQGSRLDPIAPLVDKVAALESAVLEQQGLSDQFTLLETSVREQGSRLDPIAPLVDKVAALESVVLEQQGLSDQFTLLETSVREQGSRLDPIAPLVDKVAALESVVLEQQGLSDQFTLLETSVREQGSRLDPIAPLVDKVAALESAVLEQQGLSDQFTLLETSVREQGSRLDPIAPLVDKVAALESAVLEQRGILDNALGHGVPVQMSDRWNTQLETLENQLSDQELWPEDADKAAKYLAAVSTLVSELSPLAEATYFARLARLRWSAVAFDALHREYDLEEVLFDQVEQLRAIADAKPQDMDTGLEEALLQRGEELLLAAEESAFAAVRDRAIDLISLYAPNGDSPQITEEVRDVYYDLGAYLDHPERRNEIEGLWEKLERQLFEHEARDQVVALRDQWSRAKLLAGKHDDAYQVAARMLLGEVSDARAMMALSGLQPTVYDGLAVEIQAAVHDVDDGFRREYQKWALSQIFAFEELYKQIESGDAIPSEAEPAQAERHGSELLRYHLDRMLEETSKAANRLLNGVCSDLPSCKALQDAMIIRLLPIDHLLLDLPVLKRYQRVYDEGWATLDKRPEQTCVAIAATFVPKRALRDVGEAVADADLVEELRSYEGCE